MRIFKNLWFSRFAEKEGISDEELKAVVDQLEMGRFDADLGGGIYKQRVARSGTGKSGGYRVILFFRSGDRAFFVYGFAKSDMGNITDKQLKDFKCTAKHYFVLSDKDLKERVKHNILKEI
jgi:hypothetical protein